MFVSTSHSSTIYSWRLDPGVRRERDWDDAIYHVEAEAFRPFPFDVFFFSLHLEQKQLRLKVVGFVKLEPRRHLDNLSSSCFQSQCWCALWLASLQLHIPCAPLFEFWVPSKKKKSQNLAQVVNVLRLIDDPKQINQCNFFLRNNSWLRLYLPFDQKQINQ